MDNTLIEMPLFLIISKKFFNLPQFFFNLRENIHGKEVRLIKKRQYCHFMFYRLNILSVWQVRTKITKENMSKKIIENQSFVLPFHEFL